jgi:hypothetical protein
VILRRAAGLLGLLIAACALARPAASPQTPSPQTPSASRPMVAHVIVALCDNVNQGIVPVPKAIGNGQDPRTNLYWGARFGVRTYFRNAPGWRAVPAPAPRRDGVLDRVAFRATFAPRPAFVIAEAWDGARIRDAIATFLEMASGRERQTIDLDGVRMEAGGGADVIVFVGHNGLMDFAAPAIAPGTADGKRDAVVLACASRPYFDPLLRRAGATPLVLTTGLMAPEAYSLEAALRARFTGQDDAAVRRAAAAAYHRFQKCGERAARRLFGAAP